MAVKKDFTFTRALTADDIGTLFDIVAAIGSDEIAALTEDPAIAAAVARIGESTGKKSGGKKSDGKDVFRQIGAIAAAKVVAIVIRNYRKCEPYLRKLLASLTGTTEEEVGKSSPGYYAVMLRELVTSKEIKDFFTELLSLSETKTE